MLAVLLAWAMLASPSVRAQSVAESTVGYIDGAIPTSQFRLRFDAGSGNPEPDRADFFYVKLAATDPRAPGPPRLETNVDFQDITAYLEYAASPRWSAFVEVPYRFLNPTQNDNSHGISDIFAGFKWVIHQDCLNVCTLQMRVGAPTGEARRGLSTDHVTLEPGLLCLRRLTDHLTLETELRDWIPIGGTDFAGNVVRYGTGLSYHGLQTEYFDVTPVVELVGWTILDGRSSAAGIPSSTAGDTIVNAKFGVRFAFDTVSPGASDLYIGYGRALTGEVWYRDIVRVEYRMQY